MKSSRPLRRSRWWLLFVLAAVGSCFAEPTPEPSGKSRAERPVTELGGSSGESQGGDGPSLQGGTKTGGHGGSGGSPFMPGYNDLAGATGEAGSDMCAPPRALDESAACNPVSAEPIYARIPSADQSAQVIHVSALYALFAKDQTCRPCHVAGHQGDPPFEVNQDTFATVVTSKVLEVMQSEDPDKFMPPASANGIPLKDRAAADPVRQLATWLEAWLAQGSPPDVFTLPANLAGPSPYLYGEDFASSLTNLGTCIPDKGLVTTSDDHRACDLDAMFAGLEARPDDGKTEAERVGLPATLEETDLFTLDTEALARTGVVAFAPGYPLWSDNARKLRFVRVPRGQSIHFDKKKQEFVIPPNTRFYKTFFKPIVGMDGVERWRKMETRLIVARPDQDPSSEDSAPTALFGTYVWSPDESHADLLVDWQRDQRPFVDHEVIYTTDEPAAKVILDQLPAGRDKDKALAGNKLLRHYEIPGRQRCVQCHEGSHSASFVLGFTPMQLHRRPVGEGGVLEPSASDELTQLQRLIDYGVITGLDSSEDMNLLEDSQGKRSARTDQELLAQGYVFGNCSHCHNPRGFATRSAKELHDKLNFFPSAEGGIFEFPLDRTSPRIKRGPRLDVQLPYITPSLYDFPAQDGAQLWKPKVDPSKLDANGEPTFILAPWRSVIFRNVDTPFIYSDDSAIYPHMPRNTAGYDCRASRILADWMISIPAVRVTPNKKEQCLLDTLTCEREPQPYLEITDKNDPQYENAVNAAKRRLEAYHGGLRYSYCVDQGDVVDSNVTDGKRLVPGDGELPLTAPPEGVPDRVHWVNADESETPGLWTPRNSGWESHVVDLEVSVPDVPPTNSAYWPQKVKFDAELDVLTQLSQRKLETIRSFALKPFPLGVWLDKPACDWSGVPTTIGNLPAPVPRWAKGKAPADHVYSVLPGEAVFNMICVNCHGPNADSKGIIAGTLADMTGGSGRVANFRTGLFGKDPDGHLNRENVFGAAIKKHDPNISASDLVSQSADMAARYMPWMALGGTQVRIPAEILGLVRTTEVLGAHRNSGAGSTGLSANMLSVAQELCHGLLADPLLNGIRDFSIDYASRKIDWRSLYASSGLILENGDAELWEELCNLDNPSPIRILSTSDWEEPRFFVTGLAQRASYPAGSPVGDQEGQVGTVPACTGSTTAGCIVESNRFPWCVTAPPADAPEFALAQAFVTDNELPFCPPAVVDPSSALLTLLTPGPDYRDDTFPWTTRGAMNAGQAVFLYLDQFILHDRTPTPHYDRCEELIHAP